MYSADIINANIIISIYCMGIMWSKRRLLGKISPMFSRALLIPLALLTGLMFAPKTGRQAFYSCGLIPQKTGFLGLETITQNSAVALAPEKAMDLYLSVNRYNLFLYIYFAGALASFLFMVFGYLLTLVEIKNSKRVNNKIFEICCKELEINGLLYLGNNLRPPFSCGIISKYVIAPKQLLTLSEREQRCVFLHELTHHKNRDIQLNWFIGFLECIYWFNPIVKHFLKGLRLDMEIYCDYCVINRLGDYKDYADTIIRFAAVKKEPTLVRGISGLKKDIRVRLELINAPFYKASSSLKLTRCLIISAVIAALPVGAAINVFGYDSLNVYNDDINSEIVDLSSYFENKEPSLDGCFAAYSLNKDSYLVYNEEMCRKRVSPNSTYKIAIALNALELGVITKESSTRQWDGTEYPFPRWNRSQNLSTAMKYSVNWYFQAVDAQIETEQLRAFLRNINYGNKSIGFKGNTYWLEDSLAISPIEQVNFLKGLYLNQYGFKENNINTVLNSVRVNDNLYGKTGTGQINGKTQNGWYIGIYKGNNDTYIFAVRIWAEDNADGKTASEIAAEILNYIDRI